MDEIGDNIHVDILNLAEQLKSTVMKCQNENVFISESLRDMKFSNNNRFSAIHSKYLNGCSDIPDLNHNKKSSKTNLHDKLTHKEYLSLMIKNATKENLRIRESNVKLKQESKIQDQKIRDMNHKIMLHERNIHESESQKAVIRDLKNIIQKKVGEIRLLKQNLEDVKVSLKKEQNKTKCVREHPKKFISKSNVNREVKSKVESLLIQIDLLLQKQERTKSVFSLNDKSYIEKIQEVLRKLMIIHSKLNEQTPSNPQNSDENIENSSVEKGAHISKSEIGVQVSDNMFYEDAGIAYFTKTEDDILSNFSFTGSSVESVRIMNKKHSRAKSV